MLLYYCKFMYKNGYTALVAVWLALLMVASAPVMGGMTIGATATPASHLAGNGDSPAALGETDVSIVQQQWGDGSLEFDGEFGFVSGAGTSLNPSGSSMTVETWVKHDGLDTDKQENAVLIEKGNDGWELELQTESSNGGSAGEPKVEFDLGVFGDLTSTKGIPKDEWTHVVARYDGTQMAIYINGELAGSKSESSDISNDGDEDVHIGVGPSEQSQFFDGQMDEIRVWDRALSVGEIQSNSFAELDGTEEDLLAYYPVDADASDLADKAGSNDLSITEGITGFPQKVTSADALPVAPYTHATPGNGSVAVSWTHRTGVLGSENPADQYKIYRSTTLDGSDRQLVATVAGSDTSYIDENVTNGETYYYQVTLVDANGQESDYPKSQPARPYADRGGSSLSLGGGSYASVGDRESLDLTDSTMTAEMWVQRDGNSDEGATLLRKGGNGFHVRLIGEGEERPLEFDLGVFGDLKTTSTGGISAGEWTHVAAVATGNEMRIMIDGEVVATKSESSGISNNQRPLRIGTNDAADGSFLSGNVDEVRIWDTARTPTEIRNSMHSELAGGESGLVGYWQFDEVGASAVRGSSTLKSELALQAGGGTIAVEEPGAFPTSTRTYARGDDGSARVEWATRTSTVDRVNLYRSTSSAGTDRQLVDTFSGQVNTYTDTNVTNGETYYYETAAADADGQVSDRSFMATAIPSNASDPAGNSLSFSPNETSFGTASARPSLNIDGSEITIQTWLKFNEAADENAVIMRLGDSNYHLRLAGDGASRNVEFDLGRFGDLTTTSGLNAGQWYQISAVHNGNEMSLYIDGELDNSKSEGGSVTASDSTLRLGTDAGENSNFFAGKLDEVMIWDTARSHDQVNNSVLEEKTGNEDGLIAYWRGCNQGNSDTTQGSAVRPMTLSLTEVSCSPDSPPLTAENADPPTARFSYSPAGPDVDETVTFDASNSSDPDGQIESYEWEFGFDEATGETTTHTFLEPTAYTITLTVTDDEGLEDTVSKVVSVGANESDNQPPSAFLSVNRSSVTTGDPVAFMAFDSYDPDGQIASYDIEFGDGSGTASEQSTHSYAVGGTYTATLTVTDDGGATDTDTATVFVDAGESGDNSTDDDDTDGGVIDFGIELEQEETVTQGNDVNITASPNNRADQPVSNATLDLRVDQNGDGQFASGEVVTSQTVDFDAGEYRSIELTYTDVQLSPGEYSYRAQIRKDGQTVTSYTDGTLTVESGTNESDDTDDSDTGIALSISGDASVLPGETAELTFSLTNTGVTATAGGLQPDIPAGLSVTDVSGDGTNSPDRFYITPPATGESVETTYTLTADDNATLGTVTISANGTFNTDSDTISATATHDIEITDTTGIPDNPGFTDVLSVISAFNNNQQFNGVDVGFTDVLNTISAFNSG